MVGAVRLACLSTLQPGCWHFESNRLFAAVSPACLSTLQPAGSLKQVVCCCESGLYVDLAARLL